MSTIMLLLVIVQLSRSHRKMFFGRSLLFVVGISCMSMVASTHASAGIMLNFGVTSTSSNPTLTGASGIADMSFADEAGKVRVTVTVQNTTGQTASFGAGATASKLTGFGFDLISGVTYTANSFVAGNYLDTFIPSAALNPFGVVHLGFADNDNFIGGNANEALPQNTSDTFSFLLESSAFDATTMKNAFQAAFLADPVLKALMRFQQVNAGEGSDKLLYTAQSPADDHSVPEPASIAIFCTLGFVGIAFRRRRATSK